ncbi:MAG: hypothetical protein KF878_17410 [Planctomycetes bacterium]|nr:hypothetical protein [Planctomycetota bacterium]
MTRPPSPAPHPARGDLEIARLLSHNWDLFSARDQEAAILASYIMGADLAEEAWTDGETEACGDAMDYRRVCIRWAYEDHRVINDVERELWRSQDDDPRVLSFTRGFHERMLELGGPRVI